MVEQTIALVFGGGHVANWQSATLGAYEAAKEYGYRVIAFDGGFKGANTGRYFVVDPKHLDKERAGIPYGSSRAKADPDAIADNLAKIKRDGFDIKGIVGFCGDDHQKQIYRLQSEKGIPVVCWPKTMDNDLSRTWFSLGYHTAGYNAAQCVKRGIDGAITNGRIHFITMFGRDTDWVVAAAGGFGGADITIGGEINSNQVTKYRLDHILEMAKQAYDENKARYGRPFAVIAMAESVAIEGLESHVDVGQVDEHGHPKIEPELLAIGIKKAMKERGFKDVSTDTLTYDSLRNCPPTKLDRKWGYIAGARCIEELVSGNVGVSVVLVRDDKAGGIRLDTAPIPEVAKKRFLRPEGFMDYNSLKPTAKFIEYYRLIFGEPVSPEKLIPKLELRTV